LKIIILAGGLGTRISEETDNKPKPMVLLDDKPIIWHLMNVYASQGFSDFVIATGYKSEAIENWVQNLDSTWNIKTVNTGLETQTGGRIKKCLDLIPNERVFATYGDGLGNIDLNALLNFHEKNQTLATVTAVRPPARFGVLSISENLVDHFGEKEHTDSGWINGGFFVIEPAVKDYIGEDSEPFETGALPKLAAQGELGAFQHEGFWQPMDTLREKNILSEYAQRSTPPWLEIFNK
jgi:glucose-1-phosphate cytidylyltransferase